MAQISECLASCYSLSFLLFVWSIISVVIIKSVIYIEEWVVVKNLQTCFFIAVLYLSFFKKSINGAPMISQTQIKTLGYFCNVSKYTKTKTGRLIQRQRYCLKLKGISKNEYLTLLNGNYTFHSSSLQLCYMFKFSSKSKGNL